MTMPINPNSPPPTRTAKRTQKLDSPVDCSQDLWPQDVAVKLLQRKNKDQQIDHFQRAHHEHQQRRRHRTDKRPEKRNDVRHADDGADQHSERPFENIHEKETDQANDQ